MTYELPAMITIYKDVGEAKVELPITEQVAAILHHGKSPREAIRAIMDRPQKRE